MADDGVTIRIDAELAERLRKEAKATGRTLEEYVQVALDAVVLSDETTDWEELERICNEAVEEGTGIPWEEFKPRLQNLGKGICKPAAE